MTDKRRRSTSPSDKQLQQKKQDTGKQSPINETPDERLKRHTRFLRPTPEPPTQQTHEFAQQAIQIANKTQWLAKNLERSTQDLNSPDKYLPQEVLDTIHQTDTQAWQRHIQSLTEPTQIPLDTRNESSTTSKDTRRLISTISQSEKNKIFHDNLVHLFQKSWIESISQSQHKNERNTVEAIKQTTRLVFHQETNLSNDLKQQLLQEMKDTSELRKRLRKVINDYPDDILQKDEQNSSPSEIKLKLSEPLESPVILDLNKKKYLQTILKRNHYLKRELDLVLQDLLVDELQNRPLDYPPEWKELNQELSPERRFIQRLGRPGETDMITQYLSEEQLIEAVKDTNLDRVSIHQDNQFGEKKYREVDMELITASIKKTQISNSWIDRGRKEMLNKLTTDDLKHIYKHEALWAGYQLGILIRKQSDYIKDYQDYYFDRIHQWAQNTNTPLNVASELANSALEYGMGKSRNTKDIKNAFFVNLAQLQRLKGIAYEAYKTKESTHYRQFRESYNQLLEILNKGIERYNKKNS